MRLKPKKALLFFLLHVVIRGEWSVGSKGHEEGQCRCGKDLFRWLKWLVRPCHYVRSPVFRHFQAVQSPFEVFAKSGCQNGAASGS